MSLCRLLPTVRVLFQAKRALNIEDDENSRPLPRSRSSCPPTRQRPFRLRGVSPPVTCIVTGSEPADGANPSRDRMASSYRPIRRSKFPTRQLIAANDDNRLNVSLPDGARQNAQLIRARDLSLT